MEGRGESSLAFLTLRVSRGPLRTRSTGPLRTRSTVPLRDPLSRLLAGAGEPLRRRSPLRRGRHLEVVGRER